ncbi:putative helicase [Aspergillus flavus AF70]|nr:putative helicase [Aspergillus flavus AF70]
MSNARQTFTNVPSYCGSFFNGVWWMLQQERSPIRGGILADDCGLGKTLTTLAFIYKASFLPLVGKFYKPTLILAPAGVVSTWATQLTESFRHVMPFYVFHGFRSQISDPVQKSRTLENMTKLRDMLEKLGLPIRNGVALLQAFGEREDETAGGQQDLPDGARSKP